MDPCHSSDGYTLSVAELHELGSDSATDLVLGSLLLRPAPSLKHDGMPSVLRHVILLIVHLGSDF